MPQVRQGRSVFEAWDRRPGWASQHARGIPESIGPVLCSHFVHFTPRLRPWKPLLPCSLTRGSTLTPCLKHQQALNFCTCPKLLQYPRPQHSNPWFSFCRPGFLQGAVTVNPTLTQQPVVWAQFCFFAWRKWKLHLALPKRAPGLPNYWQLFVSALFHPADKGAQTNNWRFPDTESRML